MKELRKKLDLKRSRHIFGKKGKLITIPVSDKLVLSYLDIRYLHISTDLNISDRFIL